MILKSCPVCTSDHPHLHPALQHEGEVQPCAHPFHYLSTPQNLESLKRNMMPAILKALEGVTLDFNCHGASAAIIKGAGLPPFARLARGWCRGIQSQHSWVVLGDPWGRRTTIIDPTLQTYDQRVKGVWFGQNLQRHTPHGHGSIFEFGQPCSAGGLTIPLAKEAFDRLSPLAKDFLQILGPLDYAGWRALASAPVGDWPAAEVYEAMDDTKALKAMLRVDLVGMLTDRLPDLFPRPPVEALTCG